jgi:hypothetical protein
MGPPGRGLPACAAPKIPNRIIGVLIHAAPPPVGIVNRPVLSSAGERVISNSRDLDCARRTPRTFLLNVDGNRCG